MVFIKVQNIYYLLHLKMECEQYFTVLVITFLLYRNTIEHFLSVSDLVLAILILLQNFLIHVVIKGYKELICPGDQITVVELLN